MYQALYRKYRPRCFGDVTGQEHITQTLREQMKQSRLSHAYLFVGTRGTGKTTCAKILSRVVNCEAPVDGDACNKCASCIGIENGSILDVLELDAASNNSVDNIRAIREEAVYTPALVKKRIYILDEVHMLSNSASNALLKILEEPPEHLIFILATTELHKVNSTIMSRCQRFMFRRIYPDAISARLNEIAAKEGISLTEEASKKLASLADGSMRDAISLFDQCATGQTVDIVRVLDTLGLIGTLEVIRLTGFIGDRDIASGMSMLDELYKDGRDMVSVLNEMGTLMRDLLVYRLSPDSPLITAGRDQSELSALSEKYSSARLFFNLGLIREAVYSLSRGSAMRLTTEMCIIRMCEETLSTESSALLARITKLEEGIVDNAECGMRNAESEIKNNNSEFRIPNSELETQSEPQPELQHPTSPPQPDDYWTSILRHLSDQPSIYSILSNEDRIYAEQKDGSFTIYATDQFTVKQLGMDAFLNPIKEAVQKVLGKETIVRIEFGKKSDKLSGSTDKLDALRAFDNVKFE